MRLYRMCKLVPKERMDRTSATRATRLSDARVFYRRGFHFRQKPRGAAVLACVFVRVFPADGLAIAGRCTSFTRRVWTKATMGADERWA